MGTVLEFPGRGRGATPAEDEHSRPEERLDGNNEKIEDASSDISGSSEAEIVSLADAAAATQRERDWLKAARQARQKTVPAPDQDLPVYRRSYPESWRDQPTIGSILAALRGGDSAWGRRADIMRVLSTLQRGSPASIRRNVELRRGLIEEMESGDLANLLQDSTEASWVENPSYYQAIIEELERREYQE